MKKRTREGVTRKRREGGKGKDMKEERKVVDPTNSEKKKREEKKNVVVVVVVAVEVAFWIRGSTLNPVSTGLRNKRGEESWHHELEAEKG